MNAHALWYLTSCTGIVALVLVTASVIIGILASLRTGGSRTPRFVVAGLHRNVSLMTVAFIVVHVATTIMDAYAPIRVVDAVVPFISAYRPIWLGLGALAFDIILALVITSLVRVRIGLKTWRGIHWFAYACFPIALVHSLGTGSDASQRWMLAIVIACGGAVVVAALVRVWQLVPERVTASRRHGRGGVILRFRTQRIALRLLGTAAVIAIPALTAMWAVAGPLAPKWAQRAGTPPVKSSTQNTLAVLAAQQAALEQQRARQIDDVSLQVKRQLTQVKAAIAAVRAASQPVVVSGGSGGSGGSVYARGSSSGSSYAAPAARAVASAPAAPAAPVVATGGS
jgi:DMSO/TMAO reductase YedYZ heme-binding membrane subunit